MMQFGEMNMSSSLRSTLPTFASTAGFPTAASSKAAVAYDDTGDSIYYSDGTNWIQLSLPSGSTNQTLRHTGSAWAATGGLLSTGTQVSVVGNNFDAHVAGAAFRVQGSYMLVGDEVAGQTFTNGLGIKFMDSTVANYTQKFDSSAGEMQFGLSTSVSHLQFDTNALTMRIGNGKVSIGAPAPATSGGATLQVVGNVSISTMTATPTGIVGRDGSNVLGLVTLGSTLGLSAGTLSVTEANLNHANIGGTTPVSKGGTGLTALGTFYQGLRVNAAGTALEYYSMPITYQSTRTAPIVVDNYVEIGTVTKTNGVANYDLRVTMQGSGVSVSKTYRVSTFFSATASVYQLLMPISSSGVYSGQNFEVEMNGASGTDTLRVRRTAGTTAATVYVSLTIDPTEVTTFAASSGTGTSAITATYSLGALAQVANRVGINTIAPAQAFHVVGNMRLSAVTGTPTSIIGRDGNGDIGQIGYGTGISLSGGNITLGTELVGLAGLSSNGIVVRTGAGAYSMRSVQFVASNLHPGYTMSVSQADGVAGNILLGLDSSDASWKQGVICATTANITLSGTQTIDGIAVVANDRVLVKDQTTASANGIYLVAAGAWARALDFNVSGDLTLGAIIPVRSGTVNGNTAWRLTTTGAITLGTTSLAFANIDTGGVSGTINKLAYFTSASAIGSQANMTVDNTNSRLGLGSGAAAPVTTLHVAGIGAFGDSVTASNSIRALNLASTDAVMRILRISADIATAAPAMELIHRTTADGTNTQSWDMYLKSTGFWIRDRTSGDLDRLHISTAGDVGIGVTANSSYKLLVNGAIRATGAVQAYGVGNTFTGDLASPHVRMTNTTASTGDTWVIGSRNDGGLDIQCGNLSQVARFNATTGRFDLSYAFGLAGFANSASLGASQNNYDIADAGAAAVHRLTASTPINITGIVGGVAGRVISLINIGTNTITLTNEDANSTAANRFALGANLAITGSNAVTLWYDGTSSRWRPFGGSGGGASGAPVGAQYLTLATDGTLTNERVFTAGQNVVVTDGGAGSTYTVAVGTQTFALNGIISPTGTTGTVNDYAPTSLSTAAIIRQTTTAATTLTGLTGGSSGRIIVFFNIGTHDIDFINESASSTAANRFSFGVDYRLGPNKSIILWYDSTSSRWRAAGIEDDPSTRVTIVAKTASYTLAIGEASKLITMDSTSNITLTIPTNATVAFPIGTVVSVVRLNTGKVNIAGSGGVTVNSADGDLYLRSRYSAVTLTKMATDTWLVTGDLTVT